MFYLISEKSNIGMKIITEDHPIVQQHLKEADEGWDAERIIKWMWGYEKKSENLFKLLDIGDAVMMEEDFSSFMHTVHELNANDYLGNEAFIAGSYICTYEQAEHINHQNRIKAIYKPDSKGNYIKVWEKSYVFE